MHGPPGFDFVARSGAIGKAVEGGDLTHQQLDVAQIDFFAKKGDLIALQTIVDIDVPGARNGIVVTVPAKAARLEHVLQIERGVLRPDPPA